MARRKHEPAQQDLFEENPRARIGNNSGKHTIIDKREAPAHDHSRVLTPDGQINISQSKVKVWRDCRRMYHWKFVMMLRPKRIKRPFMFGRIVHEIAEAEAKGKKWQKVLDKIELNNKALFRREIEMYGRIIEDIRDVMADYFEYYEGHRNAVRPIKIDGEPLVEHEFRIELAPGIWFTGKVDMGGKSRKMKWIVEHKTFSRLPSEDDRWRSVQAIVYDRALDIIGVSGIDGVLWDYISSKEPMVPERVLQSGKMSQARINTIPTRLRRWMKEEGKKKSDYTKLLADAEANRSNWFLRFYSPVKKPIVKMVWEDFLETANEIAEFHGRKKAQNVGRHCTWCDYAPLCKAEATGSDVDWIIEHHYTTEDEQKAEDKDRNEG